MRVMLRSLPSVCVLLPGLALAQQQGPAGHWEGNVQVPEREIRIALDLARDEKGAWTGAFAQLSANARNIPLTDFKVEGNNAKFRVAVGGGNAPSFDCTVAAADTMNCTMTTPNGPLSAPLKRTGEAKVERPKESPAVSKELAGDWEGSIETPNGPLTVVLHLKNQPDNTVAATLDSPDQNALGLPVTDVVEKGSAVEFQLRLVNGSYKGALNKEGTQLAGDWTQNGATLPLTFKKSAAK